MNAPHGQLAVAGAQRVRAHRRPAGRAQLGHQRALGEQGGERLRIREPPTTSSTRASPPGPRRRGSPARGRARSPRRRAPRRPRRPAQALQAGHGEHDRVPGALLEPAKAGVDVAAQVGDSQVLAGAAMSARRRRLLVPTRAPAGSSSSDAAPHRASRASARAGTATMARPSSSSPARPWPSARRRRSPVEERPRLESLAIHATCRPRARAVAAGVMVTSSAARAGARDQTRLGERQRAAPRPDAQAHPRGRFERRGSSCTSAAGRSASLSASARAVLEPEELAHHLHPGVAAVVARAALHAHRRLVQQPLATALATASMRSMSASEADSQRPSFSASTRSTTSEPRSRSAPSVGARPASPASGRSAGSPPR